jgi:hypothetical protein
VEQRVWFLGDHMHNQVGPVVLAWEQRAEAAVRVPRADQEQAGVEMKEVLPDYWAKSVAA